MKKIFLLATSALLLLAGCAREVSGPKGEGGLQEVTFTASMAGDATKAAADGDGAAAYVNRCIMEIYYDNALFERKYVEVTGKKATFSTQLVANRTYKVAFWADSVASRSALETDLYYTTNADGGLQAIALKGTYVGNNDARDAFFHCGEYTIAQAGSAYAATLKRPFAQVNVITTDWDKSGKIESIKPETVDVTIQNPLSKFNALTGEASADANVTSLHYNTAIYTSPASGTDATLSMDYLFASADKAVIDIAWKAQKTDNTDVSHSFSNIPYQRNYRTNIKGNLLTTTGQWNVTVDPIWASDTEGEHNYDVVADIAGANTVIAAQVAADEEVINIKFSQEPNDAGVPGTQSGELVSKAIVTTNLKEDTQLNILVESETKALYIGDYTSETNTTVVTSGTNDAVVDITATATITSLVINAPSKTVYLNGEEVSSVGTITSVEATTSQNTLIVQKNQTITSLTVHQGGLEIHGTVDALEIDETAHETNPVKVRTSEKLSQDVFDIIYKAGEHDYIDRPMYVEKVNATDPITYDIVLADPVAQIGETKYYTLASAFAAATAGQTIELLKNCSISSSITVEKSVTLDLNNYTLTCCVASGRPLLVKSNVAFTVKDGVFVDGAQGASYGAIDTRISGVAQSNVTINVSNVDFGLFDSDGNCTTAFNTNNGAIVKFRNNGCACSFTNVRVGTDHYVFDHDGNTTTTVTGGKFIVNHDDSDSSDRPTVFAFYGETTVDNVVIQASNCYACTMGGCTLNNCTMTNNQYVVTAAWEETVTVNGGTYEGGVNAVRVLTSGGTVDVHSGTFTGSENALFANVNTSQYSSAVATINVYGGQISGEMTTSSSPCYINLYGGIYSVEPSTTDAKPGFGYAQAANDDPETSAAYPWKVAASTNFYVDANDPNLWHIANATGVNEFASAVNSGNNFAGKTVQMDSDLSLGSSNVSIGQTADHAFAGTFDGQNHTLTYIITSVYNEDNPSTIGNTLFGYVYGSSASSKACLKNLNVNVTEDLPNALVKKDLFAGVAIWTKNAHFLNVTTAANTWDDIKPYTKSYFGGISDYDFGGCLYENCTNNVSMTVNNLVLQDFSQFVTFGGIACRIEMNSSTGGLFSIYKNCSNTGSLVQDNPYDIDMSGKDNTWYAQRVVYGGIIAQMQYANYPNHAILLDCTNTGTCRGGGNNWWNGSEWKNANNSNQGSRGYFVGERWVSAGSTGYQKYGVNGTSDWAADFANTICWGQNYYTGASISIASVDASYLSTNFPASGATYKPGTATNPQTSVANERCFYSGDTPINNNTTQTEHFNKLSELVGMFGTFALGSGTSAVVVFGTAQ